MTTRPSADLIHRAPKALLHDHLDGGVRGYARLKEGSAEKLAGAHRMPPAELLGAGSLVLTPELGAHTTPFQGVVARSGATPAECAQNYFRVSEQTDTGIRLAVGEIIKGDAPSQWRASGVLMQRLASDQARGDTEEDWSRASILFNTLTDEELIDPALPADRLLYRLFHEEGVRMGEAVPLDDREMIEDLVAAAINDAAQRMEAATQQRMSSVMGGMNLPPGFKMPFLSLIHI